MSLDDKTILDGWFKLLEHHHQAMRSRRNIQLSIFTAAVGLFLIPLEKIYNIRPLDQNTCYSLVRMYGIIAFSFSVFIINIERYNKRDRKKYEYIQKLLSEKLNCGSSEGNNLCSFHDCLVASWMGTWPSFTIISLAFLCIHFVLSLRG